MVNAWKTSLMLYVSKGPVRGGFVPANNAYEPASGQILIEFFEARVSRVLYIGFGLGYATRLSCTERSSTAVQRVRRDVVLFNRQETKNNPIKYSLQDFLGSEFFISRKYSLYGLFRVLHCDYLSTNREGKS